MVTAIATETGGDGGVEDTVFCKKSKHKFCSNQFCFVNTLQTNVYYYCTQKKNAYRTYEQKHMSIRSIKIGK